MPRLIDADALIQDFDRRGWDGVQTVVDMMPTIDAVPVETVARMFYDFTGDKCPCNFNDNDEWLPAVCEYEAEGECPDPEGVLSCWKQYIKHWQPRKDGEG